jgi:hypothetical protein
MEILACLRLGNLSHSHMEYGAILLSLNCTNRILLCADKQTPSLGLLRFTEVIYLIANLELSKKKIL